MNDRLTILGASVRATIQSALAAGYSVTGADLFADWDTLETIKHHRYSELHRLSRFHVECFTDIDFQDSKGVILGGGIETRSDCVAVIESSKPLIGCCSDALLRVCDSMQVFEHLNSNGITVAEFKRRLSADDAHANWLKKLDGSSGGCGVTVATAEDLSEKKSDLQSHLFQQRLNGKHISAVFVSLKTNQSYVQTEFVGATNQWVGIQKLGASEFGYCGSVGPIAVQTSTQRQMLTVARCLAFNYNLQGVWGIDFVVTDSTSIPIDVNPRLTSSCELFESSCRLSETVCSTSFKTMVGLHVKACLEPASLNLAANEPVLKIPDFIESKAILFNRLQRPIEINKQIHNQLASKFDQSFHGSSHIGQTTADIPNVETTIKSRHPILTLLVRRKEKSAAVEDILNWADSIYEFLEAKSPSM